MTPGNLPRSDRGTILQLQPFSVNDGEGIRTTVFLPGCPLRCRWCSNPETWTPEPKLAIYRDKCIQCGRCAATCPANFFPAGEFGPPTGCDLCGDCIRSCPAGALKILCSEMTVDEVVRKAQRDAIFFRRSGGGVTFSGGEPTVQEGFLRSLVEALDEKGIPMWMESCGWFEWVSTKDILAKLEHIFYDIKCMDSDRHEELTGVPNGLILDNLVRTAKLGVPITVRVPLVKGANCDQENLEETARFVAENLPGAELELLRYHDLGREKYAALGLEKYLYTYEPPNRSEFEEIENIFQSRGVRLVEYR